MFKAHRKDVHMRKFSWARALATTAGACALATTGLAVGDTTTSSAATNGCVQWNIGAVCIEGFTGLPGPTFGVRGYFDNNKGAANTGFIRIELASNGQIVTTCAEQRVAAGTNSLTCNFTNQGAPKAYFAVFVTSNQAISSGTITSPA
jgi:hypothetical protein